MCEWCESATRDTFTHRDAATGEKSICAGCLYRYVKDRYPGGCIQRQLERNYSQCELEGLRK